MEIKMAELYVLWDLSTLIWGLLEKMASGWRHALPLIPSLKGHGLCLEVAKADSPNAGFQSLPSFSGLWGCSRVTGRLPAHRGRSVLSRGLGCFRDTLGTCQAALGNEGECFLFSWIANNLFLFLSIFSRFFGSAVLDNTETEWKVRIKITPLN